MTRRIEKKIMTRNLQAALPPETLLQAQTVNMQTITPMRPGLPPASFDISVRSGTPGPLYQPCSDVPIYNQGNLASSPAHVAAGLCQYLVRNFAPSGPTRMFVPSRLYIHYWATMLQWEHWVDGVVYQFKKGIAPSKDTGMSVRAALNIVSYTGAGPYSYGFITPGFPKEALYPYAPKKAYVKPPDSLSTDAAKHVMGNIVSVGTGGYITIENVKEFIYNNGRPIAFSFPVYSSFLTKTVATTGNVPMPQPLTDTLKGANSALMMAYNDSTRKIKCRASWGTTWGKNGYFFLPYDYVTTYGRDFCTLEGIHTFI